MTSYMKKGSISVARYIFGTAQLGMRYGIANVTGQPTEMEGRRLVAAALDAGISAFDCAQAYGDAEVRLGVALRAAGAQGASIRTKLHPATGAAGDSGDVAAEVRTRVHASQAALGTHPIDVMMLHDWRQRSAHGGLVWRTLLDLRASGEISELGASVYSVDDACEALSDRDVRFLQIPFNLLDWRWRDGRFKAALAARPDAKVEVRSVLLQGLLAGGLAAWPNTTQEEHQAFTTALDMLVGSLQRASSADLCYAYAAGQSWIAGIVVGMENIAQVEENVTLFSRAPLTHDEIALVEATLPVASEALLDPTKWQSSR